MLSFKTAPPCSMQTEPSCQRHYLPRITMAGASVWQMCVSYGAPL
jgi:hypothetical protein